MRGEVGIRVRVGFGDTWMSSEAERTSPLAWSRSKWRPMRSACCCNTLSRRLSMEGQLLPASRHAAAWLALGLGLELGLGPQGQLLPASRHAAACAAAPLTRACSCLSKRASSSEAARLRISFSEVRSTLFALG